MSLLYVSFSEGNEVYPVIYVLDGEIHFKSVVAKVDYLSAANIVPPMIVVGILHPDRMKDLIPTTNDSLGEKYGGGESFISFIENELFPAIHPKYLAAPYQIIIGNSVGGLTVLNTLVHHKNLFNAYDSIDASLWWDKHALIE